MASENDKLPPVIRRGSKYRNSVKTLLPYRRAKETGHPVDNAGFFSTVLFSWITPLVWKLYRKPVPLENLWRAPECDKADVNCIRFLRLWNEEKESRGDMASVKRVILRFIKTRLIVSVACVVLFTLCVFATNGIIVRKLLQHVTSEGGWQVGLAYVGVAFLLEVTRVICFSMLFAISMRTGIRLRSGLLLAVFQKVLRVPPSETSCVGETVNLCSSDGDRLFEATYLAPLLFGGPIMFICGTVYLSFSVGPVALSGCALFAVVLVLQVFLMKALNVLRLKSVESTDSRVKSINEVLSSIKLIKMYAWEESFRKVIRQTREREVKFLHWTLFLQSFNISLASLSPYAATIVTLVFKVLLGHNVTTPEAFTCLALYNVMSFSLKVIPIALKQVAEAAVGADRIKAILDRKEYGDYLRKSTSSSYLSVEMAKATLCWQTESVSNSTQDSKEVVAEKEKMLNHAEEEVKLEEVSVQPCLTNITLEIERGCLVGICGRVGCGKSSLLSAMLGQMELIDGSVGMSGSPAYCAQQAWIMNATIRDNITFGLTYEKEKYDEIIKACCLLPDFNILQSGDLTEVGERGVNLSGGQKQRINMARAIYMDKDVYLLDDPLSAVDAHVGKVLFEEAILQLLKKKGKTVVIVTHRLEYLPLCDKVVLMKEGKIWESGSHDDLLDRGDDYYQLYKMWSKQKDSSDVIDNENKGEESNINKVQVSKELQENSTEIGRLMTKEEKVQGAISGRTYHMYLKAAGGWLVTIFCLLLFVIFICCLQFTSVWLSYWLKQGSGRDIRQERVENSTTGRPDGNITNTLNPNGTLPYIHTENVTLAPGNVTFTDRVIDNPMLYFYLSVFGYAIAATMLAMTIKGYAFVTLSLRASHHLHNMLLDKVLRASMEFFDTTPTGRILNRFQKDQDMLDTIIPLLLELVLTFMTYIISCVIFIAFVFPYFLFAILVITPIFLAAFFTFKAAVREMRRQDNVTRSPWLSHITTTITGIPTIRAYKRTQDFAAKFYDLLDINTIPFYLYNAVNRWLVTRLDFMTLSIVVTCFTLVAITQGFIPAAFAGLAITSSLMLTTVFQFTVRTSVECEANFVSAERIVHYIDTVPLEPESGDKADLDKDWPEFGSIRFNKVDMRYRDGLPLVLRDVSFIINTSEKVGIVGRTGSGKSSLGVALFRLVELASGSIEIDGVDIARLSLRQLRSQLAIIPQEPVLFTGTVKFNVDPFNEFSDDEVWQALERTHLKETISSLPGKLVAPVSENGGNFSVGERQLMCLARALLRHNKILVLDEATASIDAKTDRLVQDTISERFADCTIITIAHRLHTVMTCDRIMVLEKGSIMEFNTPEALAKNPDSLLAKLLSTTME